MDIAGARIVVTGGARGLGRAIVDAFAAKGARLAVVDISAGELEKTGHSLTAKGVEMRTFRTDVTSPAEVAAMVRAVELAWGGIDVLVNCAGKLAAIGPLWESDPELWRNELLVNLYGTFLACHAVVPGMVERRTGYVLNMTGGGVADVQPYFSAYGASKAGVMRLSEALAHEVAPHNVKVFAMRPGPVRTALAEGIIQSPEGKRWRSDYEKIFDEGRDAKPEWTGTMATRLVSGEFDQLTGRLFDARDDLDQILAGKAQILAGDLRTMRVLG